MQLYFRNAGKNKGIFRLKKKLSLAELYFRNAEENSLGWKEVTPDGNLDIRRNQEQQEL